jgi:hypothetical protein
MVTTSPASPPRTRTHARRPCRSPTRSASRAYQSRTIIIGRRGAPLSGRRRRRRPLGLGRRGGRWSRAMRPPSRHADRHGCTGSRPFSVDAGR